MTDDIHKPAATRNRHLALVVTAILILGLFMLMASQVGSSPPVDDGLTAVAEVKVGECFVYPGDGGEAGRVQTIDCSQVHYGEVFGTTTVGNDDACVDLFESYTGAENYWETGYILGFLVFPPSQHCYLYAGEDFPGSLARG